jgi:hypothetical protein
MPGDLPVLPPCRLIYRANWSKFIDVGRASITLTPEVDSKRLKRAVKFLGTSNPEDYDEGLRAGVARASSHGPVRFLWAYDCEIFSAFDPSTMTPVAMHFTEVQPGKRRDYYGEFGAESFRSYRDRDLAYELEGEKPRTRTFKDIPKPFDLLSGILHVRSQPLEEGDEVWLVICPNEHPYLVMLQVEAHEDYRCKGTKVSAIRLSVAMKSVEKDGSLSAHEKFKTATVWLDRDRHRLPLEIRAEVFVGSVRVVLDSYEELDFATSGELP